MRERERCVHSECSIHHHHQFSLSLSLSQDLQAQKEKASQEGPTDFFAQEPKRSPVLKTLSQKPFCGETPPALLIENYVTPVSLWFIRQHHPIPDIDPKTFRLRLQPDNNIHGVTTAEISLSDLMELPSRTVMATIQCTGNRRDDLKAYEATQGLQWNLGAIATAEFKVRFSFFLSLSLSLSLRSLLKRHAYSVPGVV